MRRQLGLVIFSFSLSSSSSLATILQSCSVLVLLSPFYLLKFLLYNVILQEKLYLREGTLLDGTVKKIFPYGAQIRIGETNRR